MYNYMNNSARASHSIETCTSSRPERYLTSSQRWWVNTYIFNCIMYIYIYIHIYIYV